ncbi:MAG TPA: MscL family protein [Candidatus Saccharibacteria bacterium]|nr:MscL family protein [Candidatus Saccharibacteria bacterium]
MTKLAKIKSKKASDLTKSEIAKLASAGKTQAAGFIDFIRTQGIVGLAVGLAIGTAAGAAVKQIVDGFINPIVGFLIGGVDLSEMTWVVVKANSHGKGGLEFSWGAILSSIITLLATAFVIYWLVHIAKLDRLDKKKD